MITGIHHHAIQVRDLVRAERFYCEVLGLSVVRRWPASEGRDGSGGERSLWLSVGDGSGTFIALEWVPPGGATATEAPDRGGRPGHHLLALRIPSAERARWQARLGAAGVPVTGQTDFTTYFCDPEGNRLGLSHYPDADPST
jgi:glyoxylase I family protein